MTTQFLVERNIHRGETQTGEILIIAAPQDFEWVGWLKTQIVSSDEPALAGARVRIPTNPDAYQNAREFDDALVRALRVLYVCTAAFDQSSEPHWRAFGDVWSQSPGETRKAIPIRVDDYEPKGLIAGIIAIDLRGKNPYAAGRELTSQLARSISGRRWTTQTPEFPG